MKTAKKSNKEEIVISCFRMMDDGNGQVLPSCQYQDMSLSQLNKLLSTDSFKMDAKDEKSLIEQLEKREEHSQGYENSIHNVFVEQVKETEINSYLEGNSVDTIVFHLGNKKIYQTR